MSWTIHRVRGGWVVEDHGGVELAVGESVVVVPQAAVESHLPSSVWMEAIARTAANAALLARNFHDADEAVEVGVREAMTTPPPSGPGGPNEVPT